MTLTLTAASPASLNALYPSSTLFPSTALFPSDRSWLTAATSGSPSLSAVTPNALTLTGA